MNTKKWFIIVLFPVVFQLSEAAELKLNNGAHKKCEVITLKEDSPFLIVAGTHWQQELKQDSRVVALAQKGNPNPIHALFAKAFSKRKSGPIGKIKGWLSERYTDDRLFIEQAFISVVESGDEALTQLFLKNGLNPDYCNGVFYSRLLLERPISRGYYGVIKLLLQYGANPNLTGTTSPLGWTICSLSDNRKDIVHLLVNNGARVDLVINGKDTVLKEAVSKGDIEMAKLLLDLGAHKRILYKLSDSRKNDLQERQKGVKANLLNVALLLGNALA